MIDEINVSNLALIKNASLTFGDGLTAITGETGAGKTALLSSCRLLMGARAGRDMIRLGQTSATVAGRFFIEQQDGSEGNGLDGEDEIVVSRTINSDGRSRAYINAAMASVNEIAEVISPLVDLCSQHDQQRLLVPSSQRALYDTWIGSEIVIPLENYRKAYSEYKDAEAELDRILKSRDSDTRSYDDARFLLSEIEALSPLAGEYEQLVSMLDKAENAETLSDSAEFCHSALSSEGGALDTLNEIASSLDNASKLDPDLDPQCESIKEAIFLLEDVSRDISNYSSTIEVDRETLEQNRSRVAEYQTIMRKYGPTIEDVLERQRNALSTIEVFENIDEIEANARTRLEGAQNALIVAADGLSDVRNKFKGRFSESISSVMEELEMGSASLTCDVTRLEQSKWSEDGADEVVFQFKASSGMQERPLSRIASGGELSRVMLALHVIMGEKDGISTLIFDEIDAGVGGSTANSLANVLRKLARTHQVIVVTHLAQIAAVAQTHYVVSKTEVEGIAETSITEVSGQERTEEIARMLSGDITTLSLAHADELLNAV